MTKVRHIAYILLQILTVRPNDVSVPVRTILWCPRLGLIVNMNKTKPESITLVPLKIIHKRPLEVSIDRYPIIGSSLQLRQIAG